MFFYFAEVSAVTAVNIALEDADWNQTYEMLKCNDLALAALVSECGQSYHEQLKEIRAERLQEGRLFISTLLSCSLKKNGFFDTGSKRTSDMNLSTKKVKK